MPQSSPSRSIPRPGSQLRAGFDLTAAMVIVGSSAVAGKLVLAGLPLFVAMALRFAVACAAAWPLLWWREGRLPRLAARTWGVFALQALTGVLVFNALLLLGLTRTGAGRAGLITSLTPAVMALLAWIFLRERPSGRVLAGVVCAVGALLVLAAPELGRAGASLAGSLGGDAMALGAVAGESCFLLLRKAVREPVSPLAASTIVSTFGLVYFLPGAAWQWGEVAWGAVGAATWAVVLYYGLFVSVLAYVFWFRGIVAVDGQRAGVFTAVMPVSAVGLSWLVLGEVPGLEALCALGLVLAGLWCIATAR
ncbi:MAG: DMT family transporter [Desulfovibrionaceae bacterium]